MVSSATGGLPSFHATFQLEMNDSAVLLHIGESTTPGVSAPIRGLLLAVLVYFCPASCGSTPSYPTLILHSQVVRYKRYRGMIH